MRELALVVGLLLLLGLFAATALLDPFEVITFGRSTMLWSMAVMLLFEGLYFATLAVALRRHDPPRGWIWRSYEFHDRLTRTERWWVLPWFTIGWIAASVASLGVLVVILGVVAGLRSA